MITMSIVCTAIVCTRIVCVRKHNVLSTASHLAAVRWCIDILVTVINPATRCLLAAISILLCRCCCGVNVTAGGWHLAVIWEQAAVCCEVDREGADHCSSRLG